MAIGSWQGTDGPPIDPETWRILGADAVVNRTYSSADGSALDLYIAYYGRPRPGASVHSPLNCLPGTGWEVRSTATRALPSINEVHGNARRLLIAKPSAEALVLYWYAVDGRMLASELGLRWSLFRERLSGGTPGAALVRIVVPGGAPPRGEGPADRRALDFAASLIPFLTQAGSRS
jgi:EpsI family protein